MTLQRIFSISIFLCCLLATEFSKAQQTDLPTTLLQNGDTLVLDKEAYQLLLEKGYLKKAGQAESEESPVLMVRDTVYIGSNKHTVVEEDLLRTKAIGRYDRGIKNFRFIPKKKWIGGLTFSYANFDSSDNQLLFSYIQDFSMNLRSFSVKPFIGYAIKDNQILGMKLGYKHVVGNLDNFSLDIDEDLSFSLKDLRYAEDVYSIALLHRSYIGMDPGKRFGFFNEISLGYNNGSGSFKRKEEEVTKRMETRVHELNLGIKPGICVFIIENVAAEVSVGVVGFNYRFEKQKNNEGVEGKRRTSGADFKINLFNINIGIVASF